MAAEPIAIVPDEVLTGEAVALDVQPLGFFLRALGTVIDMLVGVAFLLLLAWVSGWMLGRNIISTDASSILGVTVIVLVTVVLPTAVETLTRGRSLGRFAVGGRIVRADGGAAGFRQALIRALVGVLELWMTLGGIAALVGAFTPRSQRLGDLMAGTYCQRTRTPALPAHAPDMPPALLPWAEVADVSRLPDPLARRLRAVRPPGRADGAVRTRPARGIPRRRGDAVRLTRPADGCRDPRPRGGGGASRPGVHGPAAGGRARRPALGRHHRRAPRVPAALSAGRCRRAACRTPEDRAGRGAGTA
ncbi:RDD family protein [Microbacterium elymi]|uniref:RDD family protein n=1 Tax=Microbacterium elymi TaxID=2909587 RepID=A0ABY5NKM7_9MICO|nr:RDD family protein [Microbacterium elymi]UUT35710.1 RDD family protein [Microbacterium elymi]